MKVLTACPLDCPDTCSLQVTVEMGRIVDIDAAPVDTAGNMLTDGWICKKVKHHALRVYSPERIMTPLVRTGAKGSGQFRSATWDEAIALVAKQIRTSIDTHGADSVLPYLYNSSSARIDKKRVMPHLFERLGCPEIEQTICASTKSEAWERVFGEMLSCDPQDIEHSKLVVVWGGNPSASNTHLVPILTKAKKNGAQIVVIDPRATSTAARADVHLAVRPGTDVVLGFALARWMQHNNRIDQAFVDKHTVGASAFLAAAEEWTMERAADVCGVDASEIVRFAELLTTIKPAMLRSGWGMERNRNGGSAYLAAYAVWALAGNFGSLGSGIVDSTSSAFPNKVTVEWPAGVPRPERKKLNMNRVGRALCGDRKEWPVQPRVLVIQGANPAVTSVDQVAMLEGLAREDVFMVLHEQVMTDTAVFADVILPATTHFEINDVVGSYGSFTAQRNARVIEPVGQSRSNGQVGQMLAEALGFSAEEFAATDEAIEELIEQSLCNGTQVKQPGEVRQFVNTFPSTDDGRMKLWGPFGALQGPRFVPLEDAKHPLTLITPATSFTVNSMFGDTLPPPAVIKLNPTDAELRGVTSGETVRVFNNRAELTIEVDVDATIRAGVCSIPKGLWRRSLNGGLTANAFAPDTYSDLSDGACFNDARVQVEKLRTN
jgi:anaerobic selenocysteine-containing dehydrogenase